MRDCLIIVRAGDDSLHPSWLKGGADRRFDLLVSYYGSQPDRFRAQADHYHAAPGPRWPALHALCQHHWDLLRRYEYIAFACDDLEADASTWERLFAVCREYRLDLAQPAIEGPVSHRMTMPRPGCRLRYTNFVEIMCPVFRRPALEMVRDTLGESVSGWGLDLLWSARLPHPLWKLAIVDGVPVRHTSAPGAGTLGEVLRDRGIKPRQEMVRLVARHGFHDFKPLEYGWVSAPSPTQTAISGLYQSLSPAQRGEICFDWNHRDETRGLLRTFIANHWQITRPCIRSPFFTSGQQQLIHDAFRGLFHPDWYPRFVKQLHDDTKGHPWGRDQSIALFGAPGAGPFQFEITGRHLTLRADGYSNTEVAFGGPILYGHAASGFWEKPRHPGNIFWPQAQQASRVYLMLDGKQRQRAMVPRMPEETAIDFQKDFPGIPVADMAPNQRAELGRVLDVLLEPFRLEDRRAVRWCLEAQGGLDRCHLGFYQEKQRSDDAWDSWRLEGPAFVWYFRGVPHVHVWVHIASDAAAPVTARSGTFIHPSHDPLR